MPEPGIPEMPREIASDKDARHCWERTAPQLLEDRVLTHRDWLALTGLSRSYSAAVKADRSVAKNGQIIKTPYGPKENPAVKISRLSWIEVRKFAETLGLTPASRSRVSAAGGKDDAVDTTEDFLFGNNGRVVGSIGA